MGRNLPFPKVDFTVKVDSALFILSVNGQSGNREIRRLFWGVGCRVWGVGCHRDQDQYQN